MLGSIFTKLWLIPQKRNFSKMLESSNKKYVLIREYFFPTVWYKY